MRILETTAEKFRGLVNPYTGEPIKVKMSVPPTGRPLFFAPDTYSHARHYPTAKEAIDAWDCENGVTGVKDRSCLVCPYTGQPLTVRHDVAGYYLEGGFDPRRLVSDDEFLYYATMRGGHTDRPAPASRTRVEHVEPDGGHVAGEGDEPLEPTDEARKVAEEVVMAHKDSVGLKSEKTVVSMSRKGKR